MYTDEEFEALNEDENSLTLAAIALMALILMSLEKSVNSQLYEFYQMYGTDGVITYKEARKYVSLKDRRRRIYKLFNDISNEFTPASVKLKKEFNNLITKLNNKEIEFFNTPVEVNTKPKWGDTELNWDERLANDILIWTAYLLSDIERCMVRQDDLSKIKAQVKKRFGSIQKALALLVVTESTALTSFTRKAIFKTLGIGKYRFYSVLSERTCDYCGSLHGMVFDLVDYQVGVNASPIHSRCRCWQVPIWE